MKFLTGFVAISAAISQALAVALTNSAYDITEGQPFTVTWTNATGDVTLLLKDGPSNNLDTVATIASGVSGESFTWTPSGISSGTYAIEIQDQSGTPNYSPQFSYAGTGSTTTASSSSATGTTTVSSTGTLTTTTTSTSGSITSSGTTTASSSTTTGSSNSTTTMSSSTRSSSSSSTRTSTSSSSSSTSTIINTNDSKKIGSPLALILLTAAALAICQ